MLRGGRRGIARVVVVLAAWTAAPSFSRLARAADAPQAASATAEELGATAYQLHADGKYAEAIATYLKAYEISKVAITLFNIATIYDRKLHERALATSYYRRYLAAPDADPDHVEKATDRLTALKQEQEEQGQEEQAAAKGSAIPVGPSPAAPAPVAPRPAPEAPPPTHNGWGVAGVVVLAAGAAAIGGGLVLGALAKGKNDDANAVCSGRACASEDGVVLAREAGHFAVASTATFFAGVGLAAGGVLMILLPRPSPRAAATVSLAPAASLAGAGVLLCGSF